MSQTRQPSWEHLHQNVKQKRHQKLKAELTEGGREDRLFCLSEKGGGNDLGLTEETSSAEGYYVPQACEVKLDASVPERHEAPPDPPTQAQDDILQTSD